LKRSVIYERYSGLCGDCWRRVPLQSHHIDPKRMGGSKVRDTEDNQTPTCQICHDARHGIHSIDADGFSCDVCPSRYLCDHPQYSGGYIASHLQVKKDET
jgi:hypothetical protein